MNRWADLDETKTGRSAIFMAISYQLLAVTGHSMRSVGPKQIFDFEVRAGKIGQSKLKTANAG